ncbi:MAG: hypothetical protein PUP91_24245, partial [Rhizonema sp. PD37]|nr:hypothetical protein [Rhizonema sp. PD37]
MGAVLLTLFQSRKKCLEDAPTIPQHSSQHQIKDYGVELLPELVEISGFKNLVDVDVRFGPFTCVAGANGVGKSNLFDEIRFLSAIAGRAIAREAGVDKVLIYRYFENLPSLLQTFGKEGNYWITVEELIGDQTVVEAESLADWMVLFLTHFLHDLQTRPITQEIMRWELLEGNELTHELATVRDHVAIESLEFLKHKCSFPLNKDIPAISAVLIAGIVYLVMRTKVSDTFLLTSCTWKFECQFHNYVGG